MKKILAILALTTVAASANMTGFTVGLGGVTGVTAANYSDAANSSTSANAGTDSALYSLRGDTKTLAGLRLEAGYGMTFAGCGWFSASVYGSLLNTKNTLADGTGGPTPSSRFSKLVLKNKYNYGLELKIGYHFTKDTVGFIGIAAEAGKFKGEWTEESAATTNLFITRSASKTKVYAKPVIGIRTTGIGGNRNLFVEAKYGMGFANRVSLNIPVTTDGGLTDTATKGRRISVRPRTHEFSVTLGWRF